MYVYIIFSFAQLTEPNVLQEVKPSVLMLCGIKAGDALKVKKLTKNFPLEDDSDEEEVRIFNHV